MGKDKKKVKASAGVRFDKKSGTGTKLYSLLLLGIDKDPKKGGAGGKFTWGDEKKGEADIKLDPTDVRVA